MKGPRLDHFKELSSIVLRAKLEELFLEVSGYCTQGVQSHRPYLSAMKGQITFSKASEMFLKDIEPIPPA